ncbi:MAG: histidine phosphatase family protein [Candidatus Nanopelagicales bacterium]
MVEPTDFDSGASGRGQIWLIRHGETQWSRIGKHTGRTDLPLTPAGEQAATALHATITGHTFGLVMVSPLVRAERTATLAGATSSAMGEVVTDPDLMEWDYGAWEGRTTAEIRQTLRRADWTIWNDVIPAGRTPGEQPAEVAARCERVLASVRVVLNRGEDALLVAHGHLLRILTATWLGLPATDGRLWALAPATISRLGFEHEQPVIRGWNCPT